MVVALKTCGSWTGQKLDKAVNAAVVAAGAAGGTAGVAWITQNADKISELIELSQKWLATLL